MCRDTGYYSPRDDVSTKVVEEMAEKGNWSLMNYYLKMAYIILFLQYQDAKIEKLTESFFY